jgi:hypothetical protein
MEYFFHVENFKRHGKIFHDMSSNILPHHRKFFRINKGLLILNMGLETRGFECRFMQGLEDKRK